MADRTTFVMENPITFTRPSDRNDRESFDLEDKGNDGSNSITSQQRKMTLESRELSSIPEYGRNSVSSPDNSRQSSVEVNDNPLRRSFASGNDGRDLKRSTDR